MTARFQPAITNINVGSCSGVPAPPPTPCPPPPRPPFPWIYVWIVSTLFATTGVIYKYWAYQDYLSQLADNKPVWRPRRRHKLPQYENDLPPCVQYLIVGTGDAGWSAYQAIKTLDKEAKVFFVTKEDTLPYSRRPLSTRMWWNVEPPNVSTLQYLIDGKPHTMYNAKCDAYMDPVKFYRKKKGPAVSVAAGWCVLYIDADDHIAYIKTVCGTFPMSYQRCLLALGSKANNLPIFRLAPKVVREKSCTIRTIRDLEIAYRKVQNAKHVTVIGGGFLGTELAYSLVSRKKYIPRDEDDESDPMEVVHMYKGTGLLKNVLPNYLGEFTAEKLRCEGVKTMPNTQAYDAFLSKDGRLQLTLNDGSSLVTDYAFVCVGATPRTEIAETSFLEVDKVNNGFLVNTEMMVRTHLYAAGDVASYYSQWKNQRQRVEHYLTAAEQGWLAGANMTGYWMPNNYEPNWWFVIDDVISMQAVGDVGACMPTVALFLPCRPEDVPKRVADEEGKKPCFKNEEEYRERYRRGVVFYLRDDIVVGVVFWNFPPIDDRLEVTTEILRARPTYEEIDVLAELLGFPKTLCHYVSPEIAEKAC